jgi:hypothetical protein
LYSFLGAAIAALIGLIGCTDSTTITSSVNSPVINGSNKFIEKTFDLGPSLIDSIDLCSTGVLSIEFGDKNSLVIRAEDNVLDFFSPNLENGKLTLVKSSNLDIHSHGIYYTLKMSSPFTDLLISGSGKVRIPRLNTPSFTCCISGSGKVSIEAGEVDTQIIKILGSGKYEAPNLKTNHSIIDIKGSGLVKLQATSTLSVKISGSGKCIYLGTPTVSSEIFGSGKIIKD